jgi:TetR/AcrR family transcriptional regulator
MADNHFTTTFARLPADKRERVLGIAKKAFAENGYAGTSVNMIAEAAGISIGALYKYFRSKEDLFLTIIEEGRALLERVLGGIVSGQEPLLAKIESLLRAAAFSSKQDPDFVRIYIDCTTQGLAPMAARLSRSIESIAAEAYRRLLAEAQQRGEIDAALDPAIAAFCMDNLLLMVQYSYGCQYYQERLSLFVGEAAASDVEKLIDGSMRLIANALGCPLEDAPRTGKSFSPPTRGQSQ